MTDLPQTPTQASPIQPVDLETVRARQRSRAIVMAWLLGGFVILVFAISIVKIQLGLG